MATKAKATRTQAPSTVLKVELNKMADNPFYGMQNCLSLYQQGSKGVISDYLLDSCWNEARVSKEKREVFFSLLFSIGDITGRQHNIFGKDKTDSGGGANREAFRAIVQWMKVRPELFNQFKEFLCAGLFNEFTCFDVLLANRIKTNKKTKKVALVHNMLNGNHEYVDMLSTYIAFIIKGNNPANKYFVAKFLTRPTLSKRKAHKMMLPETKKVMRQREFFLKLVSDKAGLRYLKKETHIEFHGYYEWRKAYNGTLESVLFSTKKIMEFDSQQFLDWLDKLPAGARYRVRTRLLTKDNKPKVIKEGETELRKWSLLGEWFLMWEAYKDGKQGEQRVLEEKSRQGTITEKDQARLARVTKEAKVNVGAVNFADMFAQIIKGTIDKVAIQPFLDKIKLPYNSLVFVDDSGSMHMGNYDGFTAFDFATFMATIMMTKNPDDAGRGLLGLFSRELRLFTHIDMFVNDFRNSILNHTATKRVAVPFIEPEKHFLDNLQKIRSFCIAHRTGNNTNIAGIPDYMGAFVSGNSTNLEQLMAFPVWTIISDGNWNNLHSPEASMNDFMARCEKYLGYKPFIIAIDVAVNTSASIQRFQGIKNFMYVPANPAQIEQLLVNFRDMDVMDVYTPLQSFHRSNRYALIRNHTL